MVSRSSCAVKRQNSVRVMSSERVPPGAAEEKTGVFRSIHLRLLTAVLVKPVIWS